MEGLGLTPMARWEAPLTESAPDRPQLIDSELVRPVGAMEGDGRFLLGVGPSCDPALYRATSVAGYACSPAQVLPATFVARARLWPQARLAQAPASQAAA